jgi:hypothetical protein
VGFAQARRLCHEAAGARGWRRRAGGRTIDAEACWIPIRPENIMNRLLCASLVLLLSSPVVRAADEKGTPYYPLQVGDAWTYKTSTGKFTLKVAKFEKVGNDMCARVEMTGDNTPPTWEHVAVRSDGVYRYSFGDKRPDKPVCFLKLPPKKGETWEVDVKANGESLKGTFKSDEAKGVKVPANTYDDVITSSSEDLDAAGLKISCTFYFAKGVGLIKQVMKVNNQEIVVELEKYEPAKK